MLVRSARVVAVSATAWQGLLYTWAPVYTGGRGAVSCLLLQRILSGVQGNQRINSWKY